MAQITIEVPDSLVEQLEPVRDRLPEVLALALQKQHPILNEAYRYVLKFLTSNPSPQDIINFKPTTAIQERISELLEKNREGQLTSGESAELEEYAQINSSLSLLKARAFKQLKATPQ